MAGRGSASGRAVIQVEAEMLSVVDRLVQEHRDMAVVQGVNHGPAVALAGDQAEMAQHPELMGDGRLLHPDHGGKLGDGNRALAEPAQDAQPARRRWRPAGPGAGCRRR